MFCNFGNIDVNTYRDSTKGKDSKETCTWFTMLLNIYIEVDDITDEEVKKYEYLSFPCTATNEAHLNFYTLDYPYDYRVSFK